MPTALIRVFGLLLLGFFFLAVKTSRADAPLTPYRTASPLYGVQVEDAWGNVLPTFHQRGKIYVLGQYGTSYSVRIENRSGQRVEAVLSVDGRDAVSGAVADYTTQRGYVIAPYDSISISGFRESFDDVRTFRFTDPGNSYSSRRGTPQNIGVIGVAFFPERTWQKPRPLATPAPTKRRYEYDSNRQYNPRASREEAARKSSPQGSAAAPRSAPSRAAESDSATGSSGYAPRDDRERRAEGTGNLGTEYGERNYSPVQEVAFTRHNPKRPHTVMRTYYDDESGLIARGINVYPRNPQYYAEPCCLEPQPFPAARFAPPP